MKVLLVTPSNIIHMPYIKVYIKIFEELNINYDLINWDRTSIEKKNHFTYNDNKRKIQRGFIDYYKYSRFIKDRYVDDTYDTVIIFGLPLTFFLNKFFQKKIHLSYILDIRDKNKIISLMNLKKMLNRINLVVLSSEKYKDWLPQREYVINHNTTYGYHQNDNVPPINSFLRKDKYEILTIGTIRDFEINSIVLENTKSSEVFKFSYIGDGEVKEKLETFSKTLGINNVVFKGRYNPEDERELIYNCDFVSVLRYCDSENNKTALPNRLYSATIAGKPLVAYKGTYLAEIIDYYKLGIVLDSLNNLEKELLNYIDNDFKYYTVGRNNFLDKIKGDNTNFRESLIQILKG